MKNINLIFVVSALFALVGGCVSPNEALGYAQRAHPECRDFRKVAHAHTEVAGTAGSQTEVSMECDGVRRSVTVKCVFGLGVVSDTTCHENN